MAPIPYLVFPGTAREALTFYGDVFGGDVVLHTFEEFSRTDGPGDLIAHGMVNEGPVTLFGSDAAPGEATVRIEGAWLALLGTADPDTLHRWFDRLADGGEVLDALAVKPWGAADGQVVDRFGLRWLVGYELS